MTKEKTRKHSKKMMNQKRRNMVTIDFTKVDSDGSFTCPTCQTRISPEDESDESYQIFDTKIVNNEISELVIGCGTCRTIIKLTGFEKIILA